MIPLIICVLAVLAGCGAFIWSEASARRELRKRVVASFGRLPGQDYPLEDIPKYAGYCKGRGSDYARVDDTTWSDLDMDLVFRRINNCQSSVGEQFLYERLHCLEPGNILWRELLEHLSEHEGERKELSVLLASFGKRKGGYGLPALIFEPAERDLPLGFFYNIFAWLPFAVVPLFFVAPLIAVCLLCGFISLNLVLFYMGKRRVQGDLERLSSFSSLLWLCDKLLHGGLSFAPLKDELASVALCFHSLKGRLPFLGRKGTSDMELLEEYFHMLTLRDLRIYRKAMGVITTHPDEMKALFEDIGLLDCAVCVLSFRKTLPFWTRPNFIGENRLSFSELYHPVLSDPVANSGEFSKDVLLTGSNASGKSAFLKALAVNAILAQSIDTCSARAFSFRPGPVLTSMAVRDDIAAGESYFIAEIRSLKRLTDAVAVAPCLLFIDEILKGTNTVERLAASQAVLEELHRRDCLCCAVTHDQELPERLEEAYHNYHFRETLTESGIEYDYKLRTGPADTQNAIELLSVMGFRQGVIRRARELIDLDAPHGR